MAQPPQLSTDRFALKLGLFYAAYFLFGGIQLPFFPLWLEARGLDAGTIGLVIAVPMMVRIVAVPIITRAADRRRALKATLVICSAVGALAMTVVGLVDGAVAILVAFTIAGDRGRADAVAVRRLCAQRAWRSAAAPMVRCGCGARSPSSPATSARATLLGVIAPGHLIWLIVAALVDHRGRGGRARRRSMRSLAPAAIRRRRRDSLWRNPAFLAVAAAASLTQGSHALYYGFSTLEWRAAGLDGTTIGVLWGLGVLAEIVLFALSARLPAALAPTVLLAIGAAGAVLRWARDGVRSAGRDPAAAATACTRRRSARRISAPWDFSRAPCRRNWPRPRRASSRPCPGIVMAAATGLSGLIYAASGSLAYLVMAAMALRRAADRAARGADRALSQALACVADACQRQVGYMAASSRPRRKIILRDRPPRELIQRRRCGG